MDTISESRLALLYPPFAQTVRAMADVLAKQGEYVRVVQGYRDAALQAKVWAQGRTAPGPIVTHAPPGHSYHEYGFAVDVMPSINGLTGPYKQDEVAGSPRYIAMVAAAEALGLVSGSRWHDDRVDWPHLQLPGIPVSPTDGMRAALTQGLAHVWNTFAPENV